MYHQGDKEAATHGNEHPETLHSMVNIGNACCELGRYGEGLPLLREALAGLRKVQGEGHPLTQLAIEVFERMARMARMGVILGRGMAAAEAAETTESSTDGAAAAAGPRPRGGRGPGGGVHPRKKLASKAVVRQMRRVPVEERVRRAEADAAVAAEREEEQEEEQQQEQEETIADRMRKRRRFR